MENRTELVVFDDQARTRATLQALLSSHAPVRVAQSWEEAIELVRTAKRRIGLIGLPPGPNLLRNRLTILKAAPIPLVLLSQRRSASVLPPGPDEPPRYLLHTPFTPVQLRTKIKEAFDRAERVWDKDRAAGGNPGITLPVPDAGLDPLVIGVAHRINTFLVAVKTFSQISREETDDHGGFHRVLQTEIERIEGLVWDLTGLIEHTTLVPQEIALIPFLKETLQEEGLAAGAPFRWIGSEDFPLPKHESDPSLLRYAVRLLFNYLVTSGTKGIEARTSLRSTAESSPGLLLEFTSHLPHPLSESETRVTGMYLFLAREALSRLGIRLHDSEVGNENQTLRITIPVGAGPEGFHPSNRRPGERPSLLRERPQ